MTEAEQDVEDLVARARAGDRAALGLLYDRLAGRLYRFVLFRIGSHTDAEDVVQRIFLKMIVALPRYQPRGVPFEAWLFRLARNDVIDHLRVRRSNVPLEALVGVPSPARAPDEAAEEAADLASIRRALGDLTAIQRDVIAYRFIAGLTPRQVALVMRKREGTVRALQFRALEKLRRSLRADARDERPATKELK